jgi:hypothetical protein
VSADETCWLNYADRMSAAGSQDLTVEIDEP